MFFTDASHEQISMLRDFFLRRGIKPSNVLRTSKASAWVVAISRFNDVLAATKAMRPLLYNKANEATAVIDYYEGRIKGNELIQVFEDEVRAGRREKREHRIKIDVPYTHPEGSRLMKELWLRRKREVMFRVRAKVTLDDYHAIRAAHFNSGESVRELLLAYPQYSRETIRRILGKGRGYVLVRDRGYVGSTDSR